MAQERVAEAADRIATFASRVVPTVALHVIAIDPDDDRVLECAVTAGAEAIVSGDRDLLDLGEYAGIRIMKVADLLDQSRGNQRTNDAGRIERTNLLKSRFAAARETRGVNPSSTWARPSRTPGRPNSA